MTLNELLSQLLTAVRKHKWKIVFSFLSFLFFLVVLFPIDDLGDMVTEKVAQLTQNQIFLQFDRLGLAFFPPAFEMERVAVETPFFPTLEANTMTLAPALSHLLRFHLGARFSAEGLMKGHLSGAMGMRQANDKPSLEFGLDYEDLDLQSLSKFLNSPWEVRGALDIELSDGVVDLSFADQPQVEIEVEGRKIVFPNTLPPQIPMLGGTIIPNLQFSNLQLRGRLINRELIVEEGSFGSDNDPFRTRIKGKVEVGFRQLGGQVMAEWGGYDLTLNMEMDRPFEADLQSKVPIITDVLSKYKNATGKGSRYSLRIRATNPRMPPEVTPGQGL